MSGDHLFVPGQIVQLQGEQPVTPRRRLAHDRVGSVFLEVERVERVNDEGDLHGVSAGPGVSMRSSSMAAASSASRAMTP